MEVGDVFGSSTLSGNQSYDLSVHGSAFAESPSC